jgi:hypothetical protein
LVEFEKEEPAEVEVVSWIMADHSRGIYGIHLKLIKKGREIT